MSAVCGGFIAWIPNFYLALKIKNISSLNAKKIVNTFYIGETGKLLLTGFLFFLVFCLPSLQLIPLFTGYTVTLSIFWFALLIR